MSGQHPLRRNGPPLPTKERLPPTAGGGAGFDRSAVALLPIHSAIAAAVALRGQEALVPVVILGMPRMLRPRRLVAHRDSTADEQHEQESHSEVAIGYGHAALYRALASRTCLTVSGVSLL